MITNEYSAAPAADDVERVLHGYGELVKILSAARTPELPDSERDDGPDAGADAAGHRR